MIMTHDQPAANKREHSFLPHIYRSMMLVETYYIRMSPLIVIFIPAWLIVFLSPCLCSSFYCMCLPCFLSFHIQMIPDWLHGTGTSEARDGRKHSSNLNNLRLTRYSTSYAACTAVIFLSRERVRRSYPATISDHHHSYLYEGFFTVLE
jgi:hypothetical protein